MVESTMSFFRTPDRSMLDVVQIEFACKGTTLSRWCKENGVTRQWATAVLRGDRNGPRAIELRKRIWKAALRPAEEWISEEQFAALAGITLKHARRVLRRAAIAQGTVR
jgi:hypothetical protein